MSCAAPPTRSLRLALHGDAGGYEVRPYRCGSPTRARAGYPLPPSGGAELRGNILAGDG
jgi:hypothetical protein